MGSDDRLITTGVDRLLDLVEDRGRVRVEEAATDLGADRETIITWAESLADSGIIDIHFSARSGRILELADEPVDEETVDQVREETSDHVKELSRIEEAEEELERFTDILDRIEDGLEDSESGVTEARDRLADATDLEEVRDVLDSIETAEDDLDALESHLEDAVAGLRMLEKLEREPAADENDDPAGDKGRSLLARLWPFGGGDDDDADGGGPDGNGPYTCEDCGKEFGESWQKAQHVQQGCNDG